MFRRATRQSLATLPLLIAAAAGPATQPSTQAEDMARWLRDAASAEPEVRDRARVNLLGLTADDLPALRDIARSQSPLSPSQIDVLRETVVFTETRTAMMQLPLSGKTVMGVMLSSIERINAPEEPNEKPTVGVTVSARLPGFVAARYLLNGDVILGFEFQGQMVWFESRAQLQSFVSQLRIGSVTTVHLRRGGREMSVSFPLDAGRSPEGVAEFEAGRVLSNIAANAETAAVQKLEADFADVITPALPGIDGK